MSENRPPHKGRGTGHNPENRFETLSLHPNVELPPEDCELDTRPAVRTQFFKDSSKSIVSENASPDIPFRYSVNPYRGCEHGCIYCYARPTHEYLGFSAGLDFESKIMVKAEAPRLLRTKFMSSAWKGEPVTFSGNTDCYQPVERRLKLTRACLEVCAEFLNPVGMITKNALVTRDLDLLRVLARHGAAGVAISITTLDDGLCAALEPRTSRPAARLRAIEELAAGGVPVTALIAPCIPGLNDHEIPAILRAAAESGATYAAFGALRLPLAVGPLFEEWLSFHMPLKKTKILSQVRDMRGGALNDGRFGERMRGQGPIAANMRRMFDIYSRKFGLCDKDRRPLNSSEFRRPGDQLSLSPED